MSEDTEAPPQDDNPEDDAPSVPLEVKITNPVKKESSWNDDKDDDNYDDLGISKEDMDI